MSGFSQKQYERRVLVAMAVYSGFMLLVWPLVRTATSVPLKVLLALAPVVPMCYVIGLLARRIRASDELEQRTHLIALGVATAVIGALSLLGGFLSIAGVLKLDGSVLIWVFPVMMLTYGLARWQISRRYGVDVSCDSEASIPTYLRFLIAGVVLLVVAWLSRASLDEMRLGFLCGMGTVFAIAGLALGIARWFRRRQRDE